MADPRDFMLSVGASLADGDVQKISDQVTAALKKIPPLEIRAAGVSELKRDMEAGIAVTKSYAQSMKESEAEVNAIQKSVDSFAKSLVKSSAEESKAAEAAQRANATAAEGISRAWRTSVGSVVADIGTMKAAIDSMESQRNEMLAAQSRLMAGNDAGRAQAADYNKLSSGFTDQSQTRQIAEMVGEQEKLVAGHEAAAATMKTWGEGLQVIDQNAERATATFDKYTPALLKGVEAHRMMNLALPEGIANVRGFADEFTHMIGQFALWSAGAHLIEGGVGAISKGLSDAVHSEKEQNITGQYYQAQGKTYTPEMSNEAQQAAIDMARVYGEEVIHVQESIGLWAKVTNGEMIPALSLTNQAMKLNAVSGMNMEEIYRDTIAVMGQLQEPLSRVNDLYNIATGLALKYGGGIQTLGGQSEDAVKQMMDGMTRLSAVMVVGLGKGRDTLARIGAEVAIVSELTNTSGDEVAGHLAAAFAGIEGNSKVVQGLHNIGIEAKNNANLVEQMGAQMSKVVPIIMGAGVRKQDQEDVLSLLENYKLVSKATEDARKAMADAAADKSFESMMKTTEQQLKELRAGWEAVGITIGKEFIPYMQQAANVGNNEIIPWLLNNKTEVVTLAEDLVKLGLAFGAFSIAKTVVAVAIRAFNDFEVAAASVAVTQSLASKTMVMSLTDYQRQCLAAMSTTGEADMEMEAAVKTYAAQHNISIDAVILKLRELQAETAGTSIKLSSDYEIMGFATETLAAKTNIAAGTMKTQFSEIAIAGESMSVRLGTAFLKAIPILGLALTAAEGISFGIDQLQKHDDDSARANKGPRIKQAQGEISGMLDNMHTADTTGQIPGVMYMPGAKSPRGAVDNYMRTQAQNVAKDQDYINGLNAPSPDDAARTQQQQTIKGLQDSQKAIDAKAAAELAKLHVTDPRPQDDYETAAAKAAKPKGVASGAAEMGVGIDNITTKYKVLQDVMAGSMKISDGVISSDEKRLTVYGNTTKIVNDLINALRDKNSLDTESMKNLGNERGELQAELNKDTKALPKDHKSSAYTSQKTKIDSLTRQIADIGTQIDEIMANRAQNFGRMGNIKDSVGADKFKTDLDAISTDYTTAKSTLSGARTPSSAAAASKDFAASRATDIAKLQAMEDAINAAGAKRADGLTLAQKEQIRTLDDKMATMNASLSQDETYSAMQLRLAGSIQELVAQQKNLSDPALQTGLKTLADITKEYNADVLIANADGQSSAQADQWKLISVQIATAKFNLEEYNELKAKVQASPLFIGVSGAIDDIGKALESSMDNLFSRYDAELQTTVSSSQQRISQLQSENRLIPGAQYVGMRWSNTLAERAQQQQEAAAQYKLAHPTLLQTVSGDVQKSFTSSLITSIEGSAKGGLTTALTGQSPAKDPAQIQNQFGNSVTQFAQAVARMSGGSVGGSGGFSTATFGTAGATSDGNGGSSISGSGMDVWGNALTSSATATSANSTAVADGTNVQKTLNTTIGSLTKSLSAALSGASEGSGIASLFGGNTTGGALGGGISSLLESFMSVGGKALSSTPLGAGISVGASLIGSLFGDHFSQANEPDIYDTQAYGQAIANVQGASGANGQNFTLDPAIAAVTNGLPEGQYIENFLKGKSSAQLTSVFGTEASSIQSMFGSYGEDGGLTNGSNGNFSVSGQTYNWQQINTEATDAFTAITNAANAMNQALAPIVSISAYGKGANSSTFSPYYTPGYGDTSSLTSLPYPSLFATTPSTATYNAAPSTGTGTISTTINLDGATIAQSTSQYRSQQLSRGFQADS
jgi:hypothetical protein